MNLNFNCSCSLLSSLTNYGGFSMFLLLYLAGRHLNTPRMKVLINIGSYTVTGLRLVAAWIG